MARDYARIMTAIWDNRPFLALDEPEQRAYLLLVTQPDISAAGVLSLRVRRWASMSPSSNPDAFAHSLKLLEGSRFVVIDHVTEELLIRSFIKWDAGFNNPKRKPVIVRAREEARSELIREKLDVEFRRCGLTPTPPPPNGGESQPRPDTQADTGSCSQPDSLSAEQEQDDRNNPFPQVDRLSDRNALEDGVVVAYPESSIPTPSDADASDRTPAPSKKPTARRRSQLPESWQPTDKHREYAAANGIDLDHQADQFRNHAAATARTMANWNAAFNQWLGNAKSWGPPRGHLQSVSTAPSSRPLPRDADAAVTELRDRADATAAGELLGRSYIEPSKPPSDPTPMAQWRRDRAVEFIDDNEPAIRAALTARRVG